MCVAVYRNTTSEILILVFKVTPVEDSAVTLMAHESQAVPRKIQSKTLGSVSMNICDGALVTRISLTRVLLAELKKPSGSAMITSQLTMKNMKIFLRQRVRHPLCGNAKFV